jgi:hypothetical protein
MSAMIATTPCFLGLWRLAACGKKRWLRDFKPNCDLNGRNLEENVEKYTMKRITWSSRNVSCYFIHTFSQSFIRQWLYSSLLGPALFFSLFISVYTDGRTPWTSDQHVARPLPTHRTTQTQNIHSHKHTCLWVGFEPTIAVLERAKTVHALDRTATVICRLAN